MERLVQVFKQFINVLFSALHCRQATGVFACQGFGTGPEQRNEKVFTRDGKTF
jgi:hypothetical protein